MFNYQPTTLELFFWESLALIVAACLFAPLFKRLGLGTVLGYLAAGLAVQLSLSLSFSEHPEELLHFAEFGVVLFLFVIGLELKPSELWQMRGDIFGLGLSQMAICGLVLGILAWAAGLSPAVAVVAGLGLALSSTALVMQSLNERGERASSHGRKSFSILLFQDLAIVPLLLLVSLLAPSGEGVSLLASLGQAALGLTAIGVLILAGRFGLNPVFHLLASARMNEIMTAGALGVVILAAMLMDFAGLSYAMGAFIAGVLLAESRFRHEVEADIEPFRGLFMGLFFMAVGLSLDIASVMGNWAMILVGAPLLIAIKAVIIYGVLRLRRNSHGVALRTAIALPQAGEFGFVLFGAASAAGLMNAELSATLIAIVTLSMAFSPLLTKFSAGVLRTVPADTFEETFDDATGAVLIIGFGRFGQIVSQPLFSRGIDVTILDRNAERVREAGRFGFRIHFGDGTRRDVLRAAGITHVSLVVICVDHPGDATAILALVRAEAPGAKVFVRSRDRVHSIALRKAVVDFTVRETFESALRMGEHALIALGETEVGAADTIADIRRRDRERLDQQVEGDIRSGSDRLHTHAAVKPEPLMSNASDEESP